MWIVQVALRRPYTFIVAALLILLATPFVLRNTPADVFPQVDIPVVAILQSYGGLSAQEMKDRVTVQIERNLANSVSDMDHVESQTVPGLAIVKVFFQPGVEISTGIAQLVSATQSAMRSMPPGAQPPTIIRYSASSLPILQLGLSSPSLTDQELNDQAFNGLRPSMVTIPGVAVTFPYGGKNRQVSVDLNLAALSARGLSAVDVVNAISAQNLTLPTGTAKIGATEFGVTLNGSPASMAALGDIPITARHANGAVVYVRDVASVRDGFSPQANIVRHDGKRGLLMTVMKNGEASTLSIIRKIFEVLPKAAATLPADISITPLADQSVFVSAAISGVVHEALIAGALTAVLILLFLGNWRSTAIIAVSIPLSILCSLILLHLVGQTINIMTLGGLALAVGILVDDATVEIENIERHLHMGKTAQQSILDGAAEIAMPSLVSTLCICIVFVPMFMLDGVARYLFVPLAEAVVFAMLASWVLSRTLVPTLVMYLNRRHDAGQPRRPPSRFKRIHLGFDRRFEGMRARYTTVLASLLRSKRSAGALFLGFTVASLALYPLLGQDFFPVVDGGQLKLHVRAPVGTRVEEMPQLVDQVERSIRRVIPATQVASIIDVVGGPYSPFNTLYNNNGTFDGSDAEIMVALAPGHAPGGAYQRRLRSILPREFPGVEFYFQPADMISQTLNFGLSAPIDIQISGNNSTENLKLASELANRVRQIPGAVDTTIYQRFNRHTKALEMDRSQLLQTGLVARDVAQNALISLSSSFQTAPTYWRNPANGNILNVSVQTLQHEIDSLDAMLRIPINPGAGAGAIHGPRQPQLLGDVVRVRPATEQANFSRYNLLPVIDIHASVDGRDLGSTYADIAAVVEDVRTRLPRGSEIDVRGQVVTMQSAFESLGLGLIVAVVLVYLLVVVNFQSWLDALIIVSALPAALAGIAWMLFLTGTTLSVPALTGAIMTIGVATANSILVVSFARERLAAGASASGAALEAGSTRLRPVLMTALAMMVGMVPMALGLGEAGEQNAPLGRAVIGGLAFATISTLLFVPLVFAALHRRPASPAARAPVAPAHVAAVI